MWFSYDQLPLSRGQVLYQRLQKLLHEEGFDSFPKKLRFILCRKNRPQVHPAGPVFPHAPDRLFRGHRLWAGHLPAQLAMPCPCGNFWALPPLKPCPITPPCAASVGARRWSCTTKCLSLGWAFWKKPVCCMAKIRGSVPIAMEVNAAMKNIVRWDTGESYQEMPVRLADESGIRTPTKAELIAFDRKRQGEKTSNRDWQSTTDEAARRAKLNDGRTHCLFEVAQLTGAGTRPQPLRKINLTQRAVGAPSASKKPRHPVSVMLICFIDFTLCKVRDCNNYLRSNYCHQL